MAKGANKMGTPRQIIEELKLQLERMTQAKTLLLEDMTRIRQTYTENLQDLRSVEDEEKKLIQAINLLDGNAVLNANETPANTSCACVQGKDTEQDCIVDILKSIREIQATPGYEDFLANVFRNYQDFQDKKHDIPPNKPIHTMNIDLNSFVGDLLKR